MKTNLTTRREDFHMWGRELGSEMFEIKGGLPAEQALEFASCMLCSIEGLMRDTADEGLTQEQKYCLQALIPQVKASVDSVLNSLTLGAERKETAQ